MATKKPIMAASATAVSMKKGDSVYQQNDGTWWFYDETRANVYGPHKIEAIARKGLYMYSQWLNRPKSEHSVDLHA